MVFTFSQTASNKQTKKSLGCHQVSSLDMNMLSHPQGVATAVVYSTADGAMWAKDREIGRFRRSVNLLRNMEYNHRKNWIYPGQQVSWLVMWFFSLGGCPWEYTPSISLLRWSLPGSAGTRKNWEVRCCSILKHGTETAPYDKTFVSPEDGWEWKIMDYQGWSSFLQDQLPFSDMSQPTQVVDTPSLDDIVDADAWGRQAGSRGFLLSYLARDRYLRYL